MDVGQLLKTSNEFSLHIEQLALDRNMTYVEAILFFCDTHLLEPTEIANKINKSLKDKIGKDFRDLNFLPKNVELEV